MNDQPLPAPASPSTPAVAATPAAPTPSQTNSASPSVQTPASPPTPIPSSSVSGEVSNDKSANAFDGMGGDFDELDDLLLTPKPAPVVAPAASPATPPQQQQPQTQTTPSTPAPAQATPPAQPTEQPASQPAVATPQTPASDQPVTAERVLEAMQQQEAQLLAGLVPQFAMSPELVQEMQEDAVAATPKLLANVYMKAVSTGLQYMRQIVPNMIQAEVGRILQAKEAEDAFFSQFPKLNRAHVGDIKAFALQFRQQNPQITREELAKRVGAAVMALHGIAADVPKPGAAAVVQQTPFQPAMGAPVVTHQPVRQVNGFEGMGQEFDD